MYDVIIIGGSYAGLSAALALGRSLRKVLVIDSGKPCNRFTPHSHNFITHDGSTPDEIRMVAKQQVNQYEGVEFLEEFAVSAMKQPNAFTVTTSDGKEYISKKLVLATGLEDRLPEIPGFAECWGKTIIHCPYCHGYEFKDLPTGIFGNGDVAYHYAQLVSNLTNELIIFTNGKAELTEEQSAKIKKHNIPIIETRIVKFDHRQGQIDKVILEDKTEVLLKAIYARPEFVQHSDIARSLGCRINDHGLIEVDPMQRTTVTGVYACGDNSGMRAVSVAIASGTKAGATVNFELVEEWFDE